MTCRDDLRVGIDPITPTSELACRQGPAPCGGCPHSTKRPLEALSIDLGVDVSAAASKGVFHPNPPPPPARPALARAQRVAKVIARRALNVNDVLDRHVSREIDGVEWMLLNAYVLNLQVGGQVVTFLTEHPGLPILSPALLEKIGNRFGREVRTFAAEHKVPILTLKKPDRTR